MMFFLSIKTVVLSRTSSASDNIMRSWSGLESLVRYRRSIASVLPTVHPPTIGVSWPLVVHMEIGIFEISYYRTMEFLGQWIGKLVGFSRHG
jgi:hypothetical protein